MSGALFMILFNEAGTRGEVYNDSEYQIDADNILELVAEADASVERGEIGGYSLLVADDRVMPGDPS